MELYDLQDNLKSIYVSGDIHGEIRSLVYNLRRLNIRDSIVIVAGDCGIGFEKRGHYENVYTRIIRSLEKQNCILLFVRGNHDDPLFFKKKLIDYPYMKTISDYSIVKVGEKNILCIGGAISLDRFDRKQEILKRRIRHKKEISIYWEDEFPLFDEKLLSEIAASRIFINTVITHSAPTFCYPQTKRNFERRLIFDPELLNDVATERETLSKIYNKLIDDGHPVKEWLYGHFHSSHIEFIENTRFRLLDIDELVEVV
ncbi:MAG: metallophosphoesterase [Dysgonomonas sp.]|nr:metallophosphoesterase [Dysgonomonas sp.]